MGRLNVIGAYQHKSKPSRPRKPIMKLLRQQHARCDEPLVVEIVFVLQLPNAVHHGSAHEQRRNAKLADLEHHGGLRRRLPVLGRDIQYERPFRWIAFIEIEASGHRKQHARETNQLTHRDPGFHRFPIWLRGGGSPKRTCEGYASTVFVRLRRSSETNCRFSSRSSTISPFSVSNVSTRFTLLFRRATRLGN